MKITPFILFVLLCLGGLVEGNGQAISQPTEYRYTLSNLSQTNILRCSLLPSTERLLCELEGALDAQASSTEPPPHPLHTHKKSCKFKELNIYNLYPYAMPSPPLLSKVLEKYAAMHKRCMDVDFADINDFYTSSKAPTCQYMIYQPSPYGFGNRLLALISSFLYAILSARVLLVDYPEWGELFCEPFSGSSIQLPTKSKLHERRGPWYLQFRNARCGSGAPNANSTCNTNVVNFKLHHKAALYEFESISCPMGYARLRNVPFVTMRMCNLYLVPLFYLNPDLSPLLDALFPQRNPFHLLSRFLLAPSDVMWHTISSNLEIHSTRRIGVQIREFHGYTPEYDTNILKCIMRKGRFLPRRLRKRQAAIGEYSSIYVATLVKRHLEMGSNLWLLRKMIGKEFRLYSQKLDGREVHDRRHQKEALVDMWLLSMSHVLITSKGSTFGYIASGLSGVVPYFLDKSSRKVCYMGLGLEPCLHKTPKSLSCSLDEPVSFSLRDMVQRSLKVKVCNDHWSGWTVVS